MKKIIFASVLIVAAIACSKENGQNSNSSIAGNWKFAGFYENGKILIAPMPSDYVNGYIFNSDSSFTQTNTNSSLNISGNYSVMESKQTMNYSGIEFSDSLVCNAQSQIILASYYHINGDTLFFYSAPPFDSEYNIAYAAFLRTK